jgi:DNA repair protein RAD57
VGCSQAYAYACFAANILTFADLILLSPADIVRRCRVSHHDAQNILNTVCDELAPERLISLADPELPKDETFTTGDALVDRLLGGGIRTGKLWEVVGERCVPSTVVRTDI